MKAYMDKRTYRQKTMCLWWALKILAKASIDRFGSRHALSQSFFSNPLGTFLGAWLVYTRVNDWINAIIRSAIYVFHEINLFLLFQHDLFYFCRFIHLAKKEQLSVLIHAHSLAMSSKLLTLLPYNPKAKPPLGKCINSLPNEKILAVTKMKSFADNKPNVTKMTISL